LCALAMYHGHGNTSLASISKIYGTFVFIVGGK